MSDDALQGTLFEVDNPPVRMPRNITAPDGKVRYVRHKVQGLIKCDDCIRVLHEANGNGPAAGIAKWKRTCGDETDYLCGRHVQARKAIEGGRHG